MSITTNVFIDPTNSVGAFVMMRGYWSQYATAAGSDLAIIQNRFTKTAHATKDSGIITMSTSSKLYDVWGMTQSEWMSDDTTQADVTANPSKITRYYLHYNCPGWQSGNNFNVRYEIRGSMDVEFSCARILLDA